MLFQRGHIHFIQIYIPPNDKSTQAFLHKLIKNRINSLTHARHKIVIMGDFNTIIEVDNKKETVTRFNSHPRKIYKYELMNNEKWNEFSEAILTHRDIKDFLKPLNQILTDSQTSSRQFQKNNSQSYETSFEQKSR